MLLADLVAEAAGRRLWMNRASADLFPPGTTITVAEDFLSRAGPGELCFAEGLVLTPWLGRMESLTIYRWDRVYPADTFWELPPWRLAGRTEFPGYSHQRIMKEVYVP